jgi:RND family efflux transporter MFP subunit
MPSTVVCYRKERRLEKTMMFSNWRGFSLTFVALPIFLALFYGCGTGEHDPGVGKSAARRDSIPIQVAVAQLKDLQATKTYSGTLEGEEQANIVAKISERITEIRFHVGDFVKSGETALSLDKSGPSSQYYQADANFANADKNLNRMKALLQEGAISQQSLDAAQTAYDIAKANFEAAKSSVELTSPIAGVVTAVNVNVGDLATPGAVLITVANVNRMKVIFNVGEGDSPRLFLGQHVRVYTEFKPDRAVDGRIVQLAKSADIRSRSFEVKALFANTPDRWFNPGMFCKAEVRFMAHKGSLVVPDAAIMSQGGEKTVFQIRGGMAFLRAVRSGESDGTMTEILEGLSSGDSVATVGLNDLKDSSRVVIVHR